MFCSDINPLFLKIPSHYNLSYLNKKYSTNLARTTGIPSVFISNYSIFEPIYNFFSLISKEDILKISGI
jgi:hypothetical protein